MCLLGPCAAIGRRTRALLAHGEDVLGFRARPAADAAGQARRASASSVDGVPGPDDIIEVVKGFNADALAAWTALGGAGKGTSVRRETYKAVAVQVQSDHSVDLGFPESDATFIIVEVIECMT